MKEKLQSKILMVASLPIIKIDKKVIYEKLRSNNSNTDNRIVEYQWIKNPQDSGIQFGGNVLQHRLTTNSIRFDDNVITI